MTVWDTLTDAAQDLDDTLVGPPLLPLPVQTPARSVPALLHAILADVLGQADWQRLEASLPPTAELGDFLEGLVEGAAAGAFDAVTEEIKFTRSAETMVEDPLDMTGWELRDLATAAVTSCRDESFGPGSARQRGLGALASRNPLCIARRWSVCRI